MDNCTNNHKRKRSLTASSHAISHAIVYSKHLWESSTYFDAEMPLFASSMSIELEIVIRVVGRILCYIMKNKKYFSTIYDTPEGHTIVHQCTIMLRECLLFNFERPLKATVGSITGSLQKFSQYFNLYGEEFVKLVFCELHIVIKHNSHLLRDIKQLKQITQDIEHKTRENTLLSELLTNISADTSGSSESIVNLTKRLSQEHELRHAAEQRATASEQRAHTVEQTLQHVQSQLAEANAKIAQTSKYIKLQDVLANSDCEIIINTSGQSQIDTLTAQLNAISAEKLMLENKLAEVESRDKANSAIIDVIMTQIQRPSPVAAKTTQFSDLFN